MLKKLHVLLLILLAAVCFTATAWADYDYIEQYGVMVTPNTEDGSLLITVKLEWTPLEELPYGQELKIGVPNGSIRDAVAAKHLILQKLQHDWRQCFGYAVDFVQKQYSLLLAGGLYHVIYGGNDLAHGIFRDIVFNAVIDLMGYERQAQRALAGMVRHGIAQKCYVQLLSYLFHDGGFSYARWADKEYRTLAFNGNGIVAQLILSKIGCHGVFDLLFSLFDIHWYLPGLCRYTILHSLFLYISADHIVELCLCYSGDAKLNGLFVLRGA